MSDIGFATVSIVPSARGFGRSLDSQIGGQLSGSGSRGGLTLGKGILAGVASVVGGSAIAKIGGLIGNGLSSTLNAAAKFDSVKIGLTQLTGSAAKANVLLGQVQKFAATTPFSFNDAAAGAQRLAGIGVASNKIIPTLQTIGDTVAAVGGNTADFNAYLNAYSQSASNGVVNTQDLNQMVQAGVPIWAEAAKAYGTSVTNIRAMVASGKTPSDVFWSKTNAQLAKDFGGSMVALSQTLPGVLSNFSDTIQQSAVKGLSQFEPLLVQVIPAAATIAGNGITTAFNAAFAVVQAGQAFFGSAGFQSVLTTLGQVGQAIATNFAPAGAALVQAAIGASPLMIALQALAPVLPVLATNFAILAGTIATTLTQGLVAVTPLLVTIVNAVVQFVAPILASKAALDILATAFVAIIAFKAAFAGYTAIMTGIRIATGLWTLATSAAEIAQIALNVAMSANPIGLIIALIAGLVAALVFFFTQTSLGKAVWANFMSFLSQAWTNIVSVATTVWAAVTSAFKTATTFISGVIGAVVSFIQAHWQLLLAIFLGPLGLIIDAVVTNFGAIKSFVTTVISAVVSFIQANLAVARAVFSTVFNAIRSVVSTVINAISGVIHAVLGAIGAYISAVVNTYRAIFTAVWNAIKAVVTSAVNGVRSVITSVFNAVKSFISGVFNGIKSIISGAWNAVNSATGGALGRLVSVVSGAVGKVVAFFVSMGGKIVSTVTGFAGRLVSAGGDMISGLIRGITGAGSRVVTAILGVAGNALNAVKNFFGIHSPSTVFASIGKFMVQGWVNGVKDTADQITSTMTDLSGKVKDAFTKSADEIKAATKKITADRNSLAVLNARKADFTKHTSKATRLATAQRIAALQADIKANNAIIASDKKVATSKNQSAIIASITKANGQLTGLAKQRDDIATRLKTANDDLTSAIKTRDDFAANVQKAVTDLGNVANLFKDATDSITSATNSMADAQKSLTDLDGKIADDNAKRQSLMDTLQAAVVTSTTSTSKNARTQALADISDLTSQINDLDTELGDFASQRNTLLGNISAFSAQSHASVSDQIIASLQTSIAQTNAFTAALKTLRSEGLDDATYQQIIAAGVGGGGLTTAQALVSAGPAAVKQIAALQSQLESAGATLGSATSGSLYQAGVDAAQGIVDGLQSQEDKIVAQMDHIADALVTSIKKKLDIHSPSKVLHAIGVFTGQGMARGLKSTGPMIQKASDVLMPSVGWSSPQVGTSVASALANAGTTNVDYSYTQVGGQGLTAEQELARSARRLKMQMRGR